MQLKRNREMEFETLKKSYKKQIIIGALAVCVIGGALTFAITRAKYKLTESIPLAIGTVNYTLYDFKIMAMYQSEDGTNYTEIEEMPSSGYTINEEKSYCTVDGTTEVKGKFKTIDKQHTITNITKHDKCYIWFDKEKATAGDIILGNITINENEPTTFASGATTDEGVFKTADPVYGGYTYYWRGKVTNNYVTFAGKCWRIVRINGDGSMRIIYDGSTCHANGSNADSIAKTSTAYNSQYNNSAYVGWTYTASVQRPTPTTGGTASNAKAQLESWYNSTITGTNATKVADGIYCNDRTIGSGTWSATGSQFSYGAYTRVITNKKPSLECDASDRYKLKVGLITADEAMYAGGGNYSNSSYYLYNGQNYWTVSPYRWYSSGNGANVFFVRGSDGILSANPVNNTGYGLRPVINLRPDISISSGDGTQSNPYIVQ